MTTATRQRPIGSRFGAASTAEEVVAGIDLSGRNVVVTGGHSGIGLETTRALAGAGASVTVGSRDPERAAIALAGVDGVEIDRLDLRYPGSVDAFADRYLSSGRPLHILVNNAALPAPGTLVRDTRGYEAQFATNHLGHFQLTLGLSPALRAAHGARVVLMSSAAQRRSDIRWDDLHFATGYSPGLAYAQTKTAAVLFAVELDRRWVDDGIRGYAVHPGVVVDGTGLGRSMPADEQRAAGLVDEAGRPIIDPDHEKKTPQQGAATAVFAATSPLLDGVGGVYLKNCDIAPVDDDRSAIGTEQKRSSDVAPHAVDPVSARRLWTMSEHLLGSEHLP